LEAAGRSSGPLICRGLARLRNIAPWAGGVGLASPKRKNKVFSLKISEKEIDQRFRRPHGIGFPTVISTAFSQGKGSVMTIEGEHDILFLDPFSKIMYNCHF
jgi:hypothetical protein